MARMTMKLRPRPFRRRRGPAAGGCSPRLRVAQRDPAYAAAREAGQVGEKMDGYLGYVTPPSAALKAVVEDINLKRRALYSDKAQAQKATVEEYAFTSGCLLIAQTRPGEKYQAPDGSWQTRTAPRRSAIALPEKRLIFGPLEGCRRIGANVCAQRGKFAPQRLTCENPRLRGRRPRRDAVARDRPSGRIGRFIRCASGEWP
jgi:uncharacterized protein YdbL (DUF1318 family)